MAESTISQGDFNCRASSQADFILNYFLSKGLVPFTQLVKVLEGNFVLALPSIRLS